MWPPYPMWLKTRQAGFSVAIESGAGDAANFSDEAYRAAGAEVLPTAAALWAGADIIFKVRPPTQEEVALMREGQILIDFIWPAQNPDLMQQPGGPESDCAGDRCAAPHA